MENSGYYEGVLQLRNCTAEAVDFAISRIEEEPGVSIAKAKDVKGGIDLYLTSNKFLRKIAKLLKQRFAGIVRQSSKLHTADRQTSKKVYRGTVLFRMPSFSKGDRGMLDGDEVEILSIGETVSLKDAKTGKKTTAKFDEVERNFRAF